MLALISGSSLLMVRLQVAVVYFHAAIGKLSVPEWANGTATYYWFLQSMFGAPDWLRPIVVPLVTNPATVIVLTWGAMLTEIALFTTLVVEKRFRRYFLYLGLAFHFAIFLVHGLFNFFLAMAAALILYLRPVEEECSIPDPNRIRRRFDDLIEPMRATHMARRRSN